LLIKAGVRRALGLQPSAMARRRMVTNVGERDPSSIFADAVLRETSAQLNLRHAVLPPDIADAGGEYLACRWFCCLHAVLSCVAMDTPIRDGDIEVVETGGGKGIELRELGAFAFSGGR
jgi:hypothetical protein